MSILLPILPKLFRFDEDKWYVICCSFSVDDDFNSSQLVFYFISEIFSVFKVSWAGRDVRINTLNPVEPFTFLANATAR